jgi:hypothetical protein
VTTLQLSLLDAPPRERRHVTFADRGLGRGDRVPPGPARLLRRLCKRGLSEAAVPAAAALCLELDRLALEGPLNDPPPSNDW